MTIARRDFLKRTALFSTIGFAPQFLARTAAAQTADAPRIAGFGDGRILVVVQLGGGNDGLNTVVPYADDAYRRARPRLALARDAVLPIDEYCGFHAALEPLKRLYDGGQLAVVRGVGYPNPDRSHFRAMEIWETASDADEYLGHGWIGRYFDNTCAGTARPQAGLAAGSERPQAFDGDAGIGIATSDPARFGWNPGAAGDDAAAFAAVNPAPAGDTALDFLRHTTQNAVRSSSEVQAAADRGGVGGMAARGGRDGQLELVAGLIRGGLDTRVFYVSAGGFDTHANQAGRHDQLLARVGEALAGFQRQLERDGHADRVLTMVFSEFGRRVEENASGGTDHGAAAPMFLMGRGVQPGLHGAHPALDDLDDGDLKFGVDFRSVYAAILRGWFRTAPEPILGRDFPAIDLVRV